MRRRIPGSVVAVLVGLLPAPFPPCAASAKQGAWALVRADASPAGHAADTTGDAKDSAGDPANSAGNQANSASDEADTAGNETARSRLERTVVQGQVSDTTTGRPVAGARVTLEGDRIDSRTATTGGDGRYRFPTVAEGLYRVRVELAGYRTASEPDLRVVLGKASKLDFVLVRATALAESIVVRARPAGDDPRQTVTTVTYDREQIRRSPGTAGDVLRSLDSLPGVNATGEFSSFSVRGRGPRDNLILVDDIPFDKVVHFDQSIGEQEDIGGGGRFSIFAPNLIGEAEFQPGGWRAAYGGKNGSLLRLGVAEGNPETPSASARLDITGWELNYEGPSYVHHDTTLLLSARRRDFERLFDQVDEKDIGAPSLRDFVLKTATDLGPRHRLNVLAVASPEEFTRDVENVLASEDFEDTQLARTEQDSNLFGVTWRWLAGQTGLWSNTFYWRESDKHSSQGEAFPGPATAPPPPPETVPVREDILTLDEGETEYGWRSDWSRETGGDGTFSAGVRLTRVELDSDVRLDGDWIRYVYDTGDFRPDPGQKYIVLEPGFVDSSFRDDALRAAAYAEHAFRIGERLTVTPGLRWDRDGFNDAMLWSPRFGASLDVGPETRLSLSGGVFYQAPRFIALAADPSNATLDHERSIQTAAGLSRYLRDDLKLTAEAYYQKLDDLVVVPDRTDGAAVNSGEGHAAGIDLMLARRFEDRWSASVTYSYSLSKRDDRLGEGEYDADFHRPHFLNLFASWEPNDRWAFSAKWRYASGRPTDAFIVNEDVFGDPDFLRFSKEITRENVNRLPDFHTLNVRADYRRRLGRISLIAFIDVFNVYNHGNVDSLEWVERKGINREEGLDGFPTFGLKLEF